ncbi:DUF3995 domain-containing protein [Sorangium atrum]|uniref:DUF3995 domain-containing protein n=1 Tax=Sorangium atrum TaxID=2995308 RepID=A0ABT5BV09_9BACT|nr:DUF3995 domain-containing protein [Sorangium aterium]MDC0676837.1 DUF3995 domain-containing protein [Sorangium aterium]
MVWFESEAKMDPRLSGAAVVAALIVLVAGVSRPGAPHGVSPWTLLGLLAILCAAGGLGVGVPRRDVLALASGGALGVLAAIHVYWGLGGAWPGDARHEKVEMVVGLPKGSPFPSLGACLVVACLLASSAALVLAQRYGRGGSPTLLRPGAWAVALVLGARGVGGYFDARLRPGTRALPYHRLNRLVYSPLSLALAAAVAGATLD